MERHEELCGCLVLAVGFSFEMGLPWSSGLGGMPTQGTTYMR